MQWLLVQCWSDARRSLPTIGSRLFRRPPVLPFLLTLGLIPVGAQDSQLKGLAGVRVVVTWPAGADADRDALQTDVELKLRQAGMHVLTADEQTQTLGSMLFIGVGGTGAAIPVGVELHESVIFGRDYLPMMKFTAFNAYGKWYMARTKEPSPITEAELKEHLAPVEAEAKENATLPPPLPKDATTWQRHGVAEAVQSESVQAIIARYRAQLFAKLPSGALAADIASPAVRQAIGHMMDLEVQAAMAKAQSPASPGTVRDTIKSYVDVFLNDWRAANLP
jgi:hypothetical protein